MTIQTINRIAMLQLHSVCNLFIWISCSYNLIIRYILQDKKTII